ncbi:MAG: DNA polymerase III subunit gamma/tau [Dokdonella sp.]
MSYQALARKWRPRRFSELVGQEHVVRALSHALNVGRIHHAFLFTGTRGVGKTTIARIFAKSLNCERGQSAEPCGECGVCVEVDTGRFIDLLEIDAASNNGVDNVRELIENAQYMPTRGRFKVYLIDEVHMLSKPAFNALLKTLEEPPAHVKFLLATTDPQKLPVTVLSRCIRFNLKRLTPEQISGQIQHILREENIANDDEAIEALARAADGSLRDGLSLLDQAIAHGGGSVQAADVHAMLGTVDRARIRVLFSALAGGDGVAMLDEVQRMAEFAPDFAQVLDELADLLHRVQLLQLIASAEEADADLIALAALLDPQDVQLWYQIATSGRRDLPLAPTPRVGFEMTLLRMLAFVPASANHASVQSTTALPRSPAAGAALVTSAPARKRTLPSVQALPTTRAEVREPALTEAMPAALHVEAVASVADSNAKSAPADESWADLIERAGLGGPVGQLAQHAVLLSIDATQVRLALKPENLGLASPMLVEKLQYRLSEALGRTVTVKFDKATASVDTPADQRRRRDAERLQAAENSLRDDPLVQSLADQMGGRIVPNSVRPL